MPTPSNPIPDELAAWCREHLGAEPIAAEFVAVGVGRVHGLRLVDGRRVVVKVHPPRAEPRYLRAMRTVQRSLAAAHFPAPVPLAGPAPLGTSTATAETLLDDGAPRDGHDPAVRREMARALARLVAVARFTALAGLEKHLMAIGPGDLWPTPHDRRFDFAATTSGAEWLDEIGARARLIRDRDAGDVVVGHTDWRTENMRFSPEGSISAVYDWDSLAIQREPVLVGANAHLFTADFRDAGRAQLPTLAEALAFIADYEAARGTPFDDEERASARAALVYAMAYTARCEHSDLLTDMGTAPARLERAAEPVSRGSAAAFIAAHADALLSRA